MHDPKFQDWFLQTDHNQIDDDGVKRLISLLTKASYETALQENEIDHMTRAFLQSRHSKPPQGPHSQPHKQHHQQMRSPDPARPPQGPNSQPHQQHSQAHQLYYDNAERHRRIKHEEAERHRRNYKDFYQQYPNYQAQNHLETTLDSQYHVPLD